MKFELQFSIKIDSQSIFLLSPIGFSNSEQQNSLKQHPQTLYYQNFKFLHGFTWEIREYYCRTLRFACVCLNGVWCVHLSALSTQASCRVWLAACVWFSRPLRSDSRACSAGSDLPTRLVSLFTSRWTLGVRPDNGNAAALERERVSRCGALDLGLLWSRDFCWFGANAVCRFASGNIRSG